jgi:hypothetical protein
MKARSASTIATDAYRAGAELGSALAGIEPEIVFLFSTVHYREPQELIEGLYDSLDNDRLIVIGNTGDGYFETQGPNDIGASALGLSSQGRVRWRLACQTGVTAQPAATVRSVLQTLGQACADDAPCLLFMVADFHADASEVERVIEAETTIPVVGGFAADDNQMASCTLYANRETLTDAVVMVAASGDLRFDISIGNSLTPVGKPGNVDRSEGTSIFDIDGTHAMDFIERETGKPVLQSDRGLTSLTIIDQDHPEVRRLRSIVPNFSYDDRSLGLYGGIGEGKTVQVCLAEPDRIIAEVYAIAERRKAECFEPAAALIVSPDIQHEIRALSDQFGSSLPIAGFPSFGEIGPLRTAQGYSRNLFHNMTYILLLIGQ